MNMTKFSYGSSIEDLLKMERMMDCVESKLEEDFERTTEGLKIKHKYHKKGLTQIMCLKCFGLYQMVVDLEQQAEVASYSENDLDTTINSFMVQLNECKYCHELYPISVEIDYNIAETISILNKKGYYTKYCCEGHSYSTQAYIWFKFDDILEYIDYLPDSWWLDLDDIKGYGIGEKAVVIRSDCEDFGQSMIDILDFVKSLPECKNRRNRLERTKR